jgi:hypothetical protein
MTDADAAVIRGVVDKNKAAARIFVTGEVAEGYVGEAAVRLLININDVLYQNGAATEPLFIQTRSDTVRMTRFDPAFVWRCFAPDTLAALVDQEAARLGVEMDPWAMDHFDFYQSMVEAVRKKRGLVLPVVEVKSLDDFVNAVYLSCLLLFDKPGYMAVSAAEHFAHNASAVFMRTVTYRELNQAEQKKVVELVAQYSHIQGITNPELDFIVGLYEKGAVPQ